MPTVSAMTQTSPLALLIDQIDRLGRTMDRDGRILDPFVHEPTQYGTAYFAWAAAVAARHDPDAAERLRPLAWQAFAAAMDHLCDPNQPAWISGINPITGATTRLDHRDFFWPAVLRTFRLLRDDDPNAAHDLAERIATVDIEKTFITRPPSNWAAVWLSGEWDRRTLGLSPLPRERFEQWLAGMFEWVDLDKGFFAEPGLPNAYDLFARLHLLRLLTAGYDGPHRQALMRLAERGACRSLAVQLSDGSVASSHRSAGHTWTLTAQIALFAHLRHLLGDAAPSGLDHAANLAFEALQTCRRPDGSLSPVQNGLGFDQRIGYEGYTSDGHYTPLALAFLAEAIDAGFSADADPPQPADAPPAVWIDRAPIWRAVLRRGDITAQLRGGDANGYDGVGLTDLTFGPGNTLVWHGSAVTLGPKQDRQVQNPGACLIQANRKTSVTAAACAAREPISLEQTDDHAVTLHAKIDDGQPWVCTCQLPADGSAQLLEQTPDAAAIDGFLLPYLRQPRPGVETDLQIHTTQHRCDILLQCEHQRVRIEIDADVARTVHLPLGWSCRRGHVGLVRLELRSPRSQLSYRFIPA